MKVFVHCNEVYPVYDLILTQDPDMANMRPSEIPDDLVQKVTETSEAYWKAQLELRSLFKARLEERKEQERIAEVLAAQIERGRKRHYRRSRPSN